MRSRAWMLAAAGLACWGCGSKPLPPVVKYAHEPPLETLDPASNAWAGYLQAAQIARDADESYLLNRNPTPSLRRAALEELAPAIAATIEASKLPCRVTSPVGDGLTAPPEHRAWRVIARAIVWRLEDQLRAEEYDQAIRTTITATKIGYDLAQAGAVEATIGYALVNDARLALVGDLAKLGAGQLKTLAAGITASTPRNGGLDQMVTSENVKQRRTLDALQALIVGPELKAYVDNLGEGAEDLGQTLSRLAKSPEFRSEFFANLSGEVFEEQKLVADRAKMPAIDRGKWPKESRKNREWARVAAAYFRAPRAILDLQDATLARTRLLAAYVTALQYVKAKQVAPGSLAGLPESMRIDPYSGRPLLYRAVGTTFDVYSVGPNFRDDGGSSDESFTSPDLTLEVH